MDQQSIIAALIAIQAGSTEIPEHVVQYLSTVALIEFSDGRWQLTAIGSAVLDGLQGRIM